MLITLALKNLREKKAQTLLTIISICVASAALTVFVSLHSSIRTATFTELEKQNPLTQITVRLPKKSESVISLIPGLHSQKLTSENITEISRIPHVTAIHPEIAFKSISSLEINALGLELVTDTLIFGVPYEFVKADISTKKTRWDAPDQEPYPTLIPRRMLDLYNLTLAPSQGLPSLTETQLIGRTLTLYPNHSSFFPSLGQKKEALTLEIIGFSDKINLAGVTLPASLIATLNRTYHNTETEEYLTLYLETSDASRTTQVAHALEEKGYTTEYFHKNARDIDAKLSYLTLTLGLISTIIIIIAILAILASLLARVAEKSSEISLFYALGATHHHIRALILLESTFIALTGSILGTLLGLLANTQVPTLPQITLHLSPQNALLIILSSTLLTLLAAAYPAYLASRISPIQNLK